MNHIFRGRFGPLPLERGYRFRLYAPVAATVAIHVDGRVLAMQAAGAGWFAADDPSAHAGSRYAFAVDGRAPVPDPASRFQPDGVHAPSAIVDARAFAWPDDDWIGRAWHEHITYELHVGTFTVEGTYRAAVERLDALADLGVTAIELMPLAAFPGTRNWGYDGVLPYAPFAGYGSPDDLKHLIAAAHGRGLAVLLDVVYNHFGPEGNYLHGYAPTFFNARANTPWGPAIDVTVPDVRAFFAENACYWLTEYRFDGLRLDATHEIVDGNEPSFLHELREHAATLCGAEPGRRVALVVENDLNHLALLESGYDAQWNDDVHHAAHVLATGETASYYRDFEFEPARLLGRALTSGYGYQGETSLHRNGVERGAPSAGYPLSAFVNFLQNHDQIGNRAFGERISRLTSEAAVRALSALIWLAPSPPLLFMGEEWGASTSFLFFCDFEPHLARAVTLGRRAEIGAGEAIPDPNAHETFAASRLRWEERENEPHRAMLAFTRAALHARAKHVIPFVSDVRGTAASVARVGERGFTLRWRLAEGALHADANLSDVMADGFADRLPGETFFHTRDPAYVRGAAPAWSVRWSRS